MIEISQSCSVVGTEYVVAVGTGEERNLVHREV